jgi:cell division protein ZapA (FtsZ GTPase activity inhibitor)
MDTSLPNPEFENSLPEARPKQTGTEPSELTIEVLGTNFAITTGEDPAYLNKVLTQYRVMVENTQNISGMQDPLNVAVLTGFLLCDEINKLKMQTEEDQKNTEAQRAGEAKELNFITQKLIDRIDRVFEVTQSFSPASPKTSNDYSSNDLNDRNL